MTLLATALNYVACGWRVFPLHTVIESKVADAMVCTCGVTDCADAGKHPRSRRGLKDASADHQKLNEWFGPAAPPSNIAIVTGEISNLTVLDIDIGKGGEESWAALIADTGEPQTLMARTGSGGMHVLFKYNSALKTASNVLGKGIDCRNDGGYICAPPSRHRSGGYYEWLNWAHPLAALPANMSRAKTTNKRGRKPDFHKGKYTLEQTISMLEHVSADDRDMWRSVGIILGRTFDRSPAAWDAYVQWADKWGGKKGRNHDQTMNEAFYELSVQQAAKELSMGTIVQAAVAGGWAPTTGEVPIGQFIFYGPGNNYIYRPTASFWIAAAVDAAVSPVNVNGHVQQASNWIRRHKLATSMTCEPLLDDDYLKGYDSNSGELLPTVGGAVFNSYRKPTIEPGDSKLAKPFLMHIYKLFNKPGDADQFLDYMAHRVQMPWEKPRFALLIAGGQGVGKDTCVEMCGPAIGPWNVACIEPQAFDSGFNEYASATLVRISEAANLHEMTKWAFNERTKVLIAGSPDICQINPKYGQKYFVRLHCGVIITTNHLAGGIFIPEDDRRYDVIESSSLEEMGLGMDMRRREYFTELWEWYNHEGGDRHIAAFLKERNITGFSASNGQRKTEAHRTVVISGMANDTWLQDIIYAMKDPPYLRSDIILSRAAANGENEMEIRRRMANAIGRAGYLIHRNPKTKDGRWPVNGKYATLYIKPGQAAAIDLTKALDYKELF